MPSTQRKAKACKVCQEVFQPWSNMSPLNRFCSPFCAAKWAGMKRDEKRLKAQKREIAQRKESLKTTNDWVKEAQVAFNAYIRERDYGKPCISCGTFARQRFGGGIDAGHYRSRGSAPQLRFHLLNCFAQCKKCNRDLSSNTVEMRKGVALRIGIDRLEDLERDNRFRQYKISDLKRIKSLFSRRARLYKRLREKRYGY